MKNLPYLYVRSNIIWYLLLFTGVLTIAIVFDFLQKPDFLNLEQTLLITGGIVVGISLLGMIDTGLRHAQIKRINRVIEAAARGDLEARVPGATRSDILESLPNSINRLLDRVDAFIRESSASMEAISQSRYYRRIQSDGFQGAYVHAGRLMNNASSIIASRVIEQQFILQNLADTFEQVEDMVMKGVDILTDYSSRLFRSSRVMEDSGKVILAGFQTNMDKVTEISSSTEELSGAADRIHDYMVRSEKVMEQAKFRTTELNRSLSSLASTAENIQDMVNVIHDISDRTRMLALNASIESARAGEQGRGFSVVADEVNRLSARSTEAIRQIEDRARQVQKAVHQSADEIQEVTTIVEEIVGNFHEINRAVREQNTATREIASITEKFAQQNSLIKDSIDDLHNSINGVKNSVLELEDFSAYMKKEGVEISERIQAANFHLERFSEIV